MWRSSAFVGLLLLASYRGEPDPPDAVGPDSDRPDGGSDAARDDDRDRLRVGVAEEPLLGHAARVGEHGELSAVERELRSYVGWNHFGEPSSPSKIT